jgi:hypothetical protein
MVPKEVPDTKMDRPTDRRSQHQLNEPRHRKFKRLKIGDGEAYYRSYV